jgi:serine/threonine protein kinase
VLESRTALETSLAARWTLSGDWTMSGSRLVTRATDVENGEAVRISAVFCAADGMATAQLAREIGALEYLAYQPTVVPLLASGRAAGWLYLVTPWREPSLRTVVAQNGPLPAPDAVQHAIAVADLLHFAHSLGLAHGAVSAETLYVDDG